MYLDVRLPNSHNLKKQNLLNLLISSNCLFICKLLVSLLLLFFSFKVVPISLLVFVTITLCLLILVISGYRFIRTYQLTNVSDSSKAIKCIKEFSPQIAIFFDDATNNAQHQVAMWYEHFVRTNFKFIIITPSKHYFDLFCNLYGKKTPIAYCEPNRMLSKLLSVSIKSIYYVNNSSTNAQVLSLDLPILHVQILHGESDKSSSYSKVTSCYDKIFVAGQKGIDRYREHNVLIPREKFEIVSRPQLSGIRRINHPQIVKTVLFAPTWKGTVDEKAYSAMEIGEHLVAKLIENNLNVLFRPHPYNDRNFDFAQARKRIDNMLAKSNQMSKGILSHKLSFDCEGNSIADLINMSDMIVGDISSVIVDYLSSLKPIIMSAVYTNVDQFIKENELAKCAYVLDRNLEGFDQLLADIQSKDSLFKDRKKMCEYYLSDLKTDTFSKTVASLIHK